MIPAALVLLAALAGAPEEVLAPLTADQLPSGWELKAEHRVTGARCQTFSARLGGEIQAIVTQELSLRGYPLKVNWVTAAEEKDARAIAARLQQTGNPVARRGHVVVEFAGGNLIAAKAVRHATGLTPDESARWRLELRLACIEKHDYMTANPVFNQFLQRESATDPAPFNARIQELTRDWEFGHTLTLWSGDGESCQARFECTPPPDDEHQEGELRVLTFSDLPEDQGIPYVDVVATVETRARYHPSTASPAPGARRSRFWPDDNDYISGLALELTAEAEDDRQTLNALFDHVATAMRPGRDGRRGTRHGAEQALRQGFGQCWDRSDALNALCRSAGLPVRQIAGWVPAMNAGHIWSEVYLEDEGWLPVDATTRWLGISEDYVPYLMTESGHLPVLYLRLPGIEQLSP